MTPFAKNANQHRQKVPRYVDEGQLNEEKHNAALFPGHLRSDTTGGREKSRSGTCMLTGLLKCFSFPGIP